MSKRIVILLLLIFCAGFAFGQQISRIAIVDLQRVNNEFYRESAAVRQFNERTARVQVDIEKMQNEIRELIARRDIAVSLNNQAEANRLEIEINRSREYFGSYYQARIAELERERVYLMQSDTFLNQIYDEIRYIAESEGFTHVFDINQTPGLLWFSPGFDITDRLLQSLRTRIRY
ncbi:MAG: OmpH family outer membrane protein [Treponema sp.]|nr:OmpH family outer membrane protein [Treponema sp.]